MPPQQLIAQQLSYRVDVRILIQSSECVQLKWTRTKGFACTKWSLGIGKILKFNAEVVLKVSFLNRDYW